MGKLKTLSQKIKGKV